MPRSVRGADEIKCFLILHKNSARKNAGGKGFILCRRRFSNNRIFTKSMFRSVLQFLDTNDARAYLLCKMFVVRDDNERHIMQHRLPRDHFPNLRLRNGIETRRDLIRDEDARRRIQRTQDRETLQLPAREFVWEAR